MSHEDLLERLLLVVRRQAGSPDFPFYALTADNLIKMVLISQRISAGIPVLMLGDSGCGKTSLLAYLAIAAGVALRTLDVHAGRTREEVLEFARSAERDAISSKAQVWAFFDELNTTPLVGLISDIICHRILDGRPISPLLVPLGAANPYRLKPEAAARLGGLPPSPLPPRGRVVGLALPRRAAASAAPSEPLVDLSKDLVYRVHPLPESLGQFAFDYGTLERRDELAYIRTMCESGAAAVLTAGAYSALDLVVDLLAASQQFIRNAETPWAVSLRDVSRWITLFVWFKANLKRVPVTKEAHHCDSSFVEFFAEGYKRVTRRWGGRASYDASCASPPGPSVVDEREVLKKAIVLALSHCYLSRLPSAAMRNEFKAMVAAVVSSGLGSPLTPDEFERLRLEEMHDYLDRMALPAGIAKNAALLENVFVALVCLQTKIPLFIVGKPGSSKSLSLSLINANLRGPDSSDPWFRTLPQVFIVSFQGSESSTSEGVLKVFQKARRCGRAEVAPVVLLDEVGLAEVSPHNPLKILHSLLEPRNSAEKVAVIGISNWVLDASKVIFTL